MADGTAPAAPATAPANGAAPPAAATAPRPAPSEGGNLPTPGLKTSGKGKAPEAKAEGAPKPAAGAPEADDGFEIVVKGEKKRVTRAEAIRRLQLDEGGTNKWAEAQKLTQKNQQLLSQLTDNTEEALKEAGVDVEAFATKVLKGRISSELEKQLPPEERQVLEERRELEKSRAELKRYQDNEAKAKQEAADEVVFKRLEKGFIEAAQRNGLEGTPENLEKMIGIASEWLDLGFPFNEDHVIAELKEREDATFSKLEAKVTKGLKGAALAKRLGPTVVEEILRWSVEQLRGGGTPAAAAKAPAAHEEPKPSPYMSEGEYRRKHGI